MLTIVFIECQERQPHNERALYWRTREALKTWHVT